MRRQEPFAFMFLILGIASATLMGGEQEIRFRPWRCPANGDINVLYCYLRVNGVMCEYSALVREQSEALGDGPCTAATLAHLAATNGLPLQVVSLTMNELESCALPVIVHMDHETPEAGSFLLVLGITADKRIIHLKGASATIQFISREDFRRVWSGIALLPVKSRKKEAFFCTIGLTTGLILAGWLFSFARSKIYLNT